MSGRLKAVIVMSADRLPEVLPDPVRARLDESLEWIRPPAEARDVPNALAELGDVEVLVTGWGGAYLDDAALDAMPSLSLVVVASGSIRHVAGDEFWARGIPIVSAASANAIPVIEFAVAQIALGLKHAHRLAREAREHRALTRDGIDGAFDTTVGLLSLGEIGRGVLSRLAAFDVDVLAYDPVAPAAARATLTDLDTVFARSQVVSVHTPLLPETTGLIGRDLLQRMPYGATLLNTSRGALVEERELLDVLAARPDLTAVLDVTVNEPLPLDSPLRDAPNVVLTGHIAGSLGKERARLGHLVADEIERYARGEPLRHRVDPSTATMRA